MSGKNNSTPSSVLCSISIYFKEIISKISLNSTLSLQFVLEQSERMWVKMKKKVFLLLIAFLLLFF